MCYLIYYKQVEIQMNCQNSINYVQWCFWNSHDSFFDECNRTFWKKNFTQYENMSLKYSQVCAMLQYLRILPSHYIKFDFNNFHAHNLNKIRKKNAKILPIDQNIARCESFDFNMRFFHQNCKKKRIFKFWS